MRAPSPVRLVGWILGWILAAACAGPAFGEDGWAARADAVFQRVIPSSIAVTCMTQTDDGFLWFGTQNGLARWDGYRLRTHAADISTPGALPDAYITALHNDSKGTLWVGTSAGGLARYDPARDRFDVSVTARTPLSHKGVLAIAGDGGGGLWVGTGAGLDFVDTAAGVVRRHADAAGRMGLPEAAVGALLADRAGGLWIGTHSGLYRRMPGSDVVRAVSLGARAGESPVVTRLLQDADGRIWVGTRVHGAFVIEPGKAAPTPLEQFAAGGDARSDAIHAMTEAAPGQVWLGTEGGGILRVDARAKTIRRERHHDRVRGSLPDDDVFALFRDRSGLVWVGSDTGVSFHPVAQRGVATWFGGDGRRRGISHMNVPFVLAMPNGDAWLSVGDGGIDIVRPAEGRIAQLRPDARAPRTALPPGRVLGMALSPTGDVYIGTQRGLYRADAAARRVVRIEVPGRSPTASVWTLCVQGGRLWLGGLDGLWGVEPDGGNRMRVSAREQGKRLGDQRVSALLADGERHLWVGTRTSLVRLSLDTLQTASLPQEQPSRIGIPGGYVSSLLKDLRGRLWVGIFGAGVRVAELDEAGQAVSIRRLTTAEGLPHNGVNAMVSDPRGDVWLSTDDGLARVAVDTLAAKALRGADGVGIPAYWTSAAAATPDGHVLFGGSGGLTIIDPSRVSEWTYRAPIAVTEVRLGDDAPRAAHHPASGPPLVIGAGRRSLLIEYAALDYSASDRNRYEYRLRGVDTRWIPTEATRRLAAYTNLPPGDYLLELRATNREGTWSMPLEIPLRVEARWHESGWFHGLAALVAVALLAALLQARTLYLRRRQRTLEALVAARTAQLEERSAQLQRSQQQLEQIAYFDGLTGLANRRLFNDDLRRLVARHRRGAGGFALLLVDLDHFKPINDTFGHDVGDAVLVAVGERLCKAVREADRVARLGGDEFAILLAETTERAAVETACRRIVAGFASPVVHGNVPIPISASVGAACCPEDAQSAEALYKAADRALYEAKGAGRGVWRLHAIGEMV